MFAKCSALLRCKMVQTAKYYYKYQVYQNLGKKSVKKALSFVTFCCSLQQCKSNSSYLKACSWLLQEAVSCKAVNCECKTNIQIEDRINSG